MPPEDKTPSATADVPDDEPRIPHLVVLNGPEVGSVFVLAKAESIAGTASTADIRLSQETVSRRHARLTVRDGQVVVEDLGSTNGTYVGIERVKAPTVVPEGANIGLGLFALLRLTYSPAASGVLSRLAGQRRAKLSTRSYLLDLLRSEHAYARRHGSPLTIVFVRADAVSSVEPDAGAAIRDEAMGVVGTEIDAAIRTEDFLARSADDEFVILVRSGADAAATLAERVRSRIESRAALPGSALAFHTITAVVLPLRALSLQIASGAAPRPVTPEDILSTARALAGPAMHVSSNTVIRLQALAI